VSRIQIAEDIGVKIRAPWLGPPNAWRWPFDAWYGAWALWGALTVLSWMVLHWALPAGVILIAGVYLISRYTGQQVMPDRPALIRRTLTGMILLLLIPILPNWRLWVLPMSFVMAAIVAPMVGLWLVRRYGKYVDPNRPMAYWFTVPGNAARGPRADKEDEIDPARLALAVDFTDPDTLEVNL
jgi:hypothetical protein